MKKNIARSLYARGAKTKYEKSLLKATYDRDTDAPKEKHVQVVIWTLQGNDSSMPPLQALTLLKERLIQSQWATVLKAEIIIHRGIEQLSEGYSNQVFQINTSLQSFADPSERGSAHNRIIGDYMNYIKSYAYNKSRNGSVLKLGASNRQAEFESLNPGDLVKEIGYLISQLQNLCKLGPSFQQCIKNYNLKVTKNAAFFVLKDANEIYKTVELGIRVMLAEMDEMDEEIEELANDIHRRFGICKNMLNQFYMVIDTLPNPAAIKRPNIQDIPRNQRRSVGGTSEENGRRYNAREPIQDTLPVDLQLSEEELEMQRRMLEEFERKKETEVEQQKRALEEYERKKKQEEAERRRIEEREKQRQQQHDNKRKEEQSHVNRKSSDLLFEPDTPEPQKPQQPAAPQPPSKADLIMAAFNTAPAPPVQDPNQGMQGMGMMPGMMGMGTGMPMMHPGMMGMGTGMPMMMPGMMGMGTGMPGMMMPGMMTGMMPGMGMGMGMQGQGQGMGMQGYGMGQSYGAMGQAGMGQGQAGMGQGQVGMGQGQAGMGYGQGASAHSNLPQNQSTPGAGSSTNPFDNPNPYGGAPSSSNNPFDAPSSGKNPGKANDPFSDLIQNPHIQNHSINCFWQFPQSTASNYHASAIIKAKHAYSPPHQVHPPQNSRAQTHFGPHCKPPPAFP